VAGGVAERTLRLNHRRSALRLGSSAGSGLIDRSIWFANAVSWRCRTPTNPSLGTRGCGHNVNTTSDAFGNGIFDGWSIVTGHEYAEAVTDPDNYFSNQDGWNDASGSENGDKCAWTNTQNIALGGRQFAVQPLWSNEAFDAGRDGCAVSR
jgi:hypothetical protein